MRFLFLLTASSCLAAPVDFVREVRPIFEKHCFECHGEKKRKSGLRLDVKAAALKGGDNHGPDIIPGKAKDSPLIRLVMSENINRGQYLAQSRRIQELNVPAMRAR